MMLATSLAMQVLPQSEDAKHDGGFGRPVIRSDLHCPTVQHGTVYCRGPKHWRFIVKRLISILFLIAIVNSAQAQSTIKRTELKRADLTGKDMDVIVTVVEVPPGETLGRHELLPV